MESITPRSTISSDPNNDPDHISITCYERDVPAFVEKEIEELYENVYSSVAKFAIYGGLERASTYIVRRGNKPVTIFLFINDGKTVRVLNELITIDDESINHFSGSIFAYYPSVAAITFRAIRPELRRLSYPHQLFNHAEDIVVRLPATVDDYMRQLGKSTRRTIKSYTAKLMRSSPSFTYQWYETDQINEGEVREIIRMNRERMMVKNRVSHITEEETLRILNMVRACGMVCVATINGRICGGTIAYGSGKNYFIAVTAHRPEYDIFKLGTLCSYLAVCECINRGGEECHFLWGQYEYKFSLLGEQRNLDNLTLYRSPSHFVRNMDRVVMTIVEGYVRIAKLWMHEGLRRHRRLPQFVFTVVKGLRNMNRHAMGLLGRGT